ncbi:hypothetical protein Ccrd_023085 [Cynara cardunculus var. scolymus]|uniref:Armadillo-like helical n=1 Tax=Cynara cardunculus var. scolymus TaxID=59895 RepID=A0A103XXJ1_CYNCS|nr:hypothetical protein Ccrd_023085 [Cynara cardunculus var. scolymus]
MEDEVDRFQMDTSGPRDAERCSFCPNRRLHPKRDEADSFAIRLDDSFDLESTLLGLTLSHIESFNFGLVKQSILPRVHGLALKTTVAAVRVNALLCLGDMVVIVDKPAILEILQTVQRCTAVDRSAPTLMCTLGVANSILKQHGVDFVVEHVLPLVIPLLLAQQLNVQQFAKYMSFVKSVLRKVEEKKGVTMNDSGVDAKSFPIPDGSFTQPLKKSVPTASSSLKGNVTWDEDWVPARGSSMEAKPVTSTPPSQPKRDHSKDLEFPIPSMQQTSTSCPAVDFEWPPQSSSDISQNIKNSASFDDLDPFANWAMPGAASSNGLSVNRKASTGTENQSITNWANNPIEYPSNGVTSQNSIGSLRNNQGMGTKPTDLGSIFASSSKSPQAPRLAPPPQTAVGRGRGSRNQGPSGRQSRPKPSSEQPPLLDLL